MKLLVFLIIGLPLAFVIWLIVRIVQAHARIEELSHRQDDLELEIIRLKKGLATTAPTPATPRPTANAVSAVQPKATPPAIPKPATAPEPEKTTEIIPPVAVPPMPKLPPAPAIPAPPVIPKVSTPQETETIQPFTIAEPEFFPTQSSTKTPPPRPALAQVDEPVITSASTPPPPLTAPTEAVPSATPPAEKKESIEMRIGTYWTVRVGIVIIVTCLAFAANLAYQNIVPKLGPGGKISLLYFASGLLLGAGAWWQRRAAKATLKNYAQVLFAGGLAAVYFTTYAAHHIRPLCVIASAVVDGTLLLAWASVILWIADRRKSEVMALFAVGLAFYSSVITRVGDFTLYSNLVLTLAAVGFLLRNRWAGLSCASLVMSYAAYAFWRFLHAEGWRWATPDEGLNFGAAFLASYWLIFTVATFASKSEKLTGPSRAAFLSFNNGAFFALFLLTMLQVHSGGFWKFALGYGIVLLALAALARKTLPGEPLVKNTYLTQGLLLVTLGFITKFAGYQLALVLGVESVMLYLLGTQRPSVVLKFFAYATALLALGWNIASLQPFALSCFWTSLALGAFMAINAACAHRLEKTPPSARLETTAFTLLAFAAWAAATWSYTLEPHLPVALVLGMESIVLFNFVARRQSETPKIFAYLAALIGVVWATVNLEHFDHTGLWIGTMLGGLMLVNAYWAHRDDQGNTTPPLRTEPTLFTLLAFAGWLAVTWFNSTAEHLPLVLAAEAVALTLSIYALRLREVTILGQFFLVLAQVAWFGHFLTTTPPWWNPLALIAVTIGLSHWWQKQKCLAIPARFSTGCQSLFALASVGLVLAWLHPQVHAPTWLALTSLLAVAATIYGVVFRAWPLAICAQIFLAVSTGNFSPKSGPRNRTGSSRSPRSRGCLPSRSPPSAG